MSKIKILPETLSNQIAAGEVVDRPTSVIKELIENAIDAKSTKIIVEIRDGGVSLIRVSDNGTGMSRDDALMSLERYATSKIRNIYDLFAITTLGFRGEAIPSIASISKLSIVTREKHSNIGTKIDVIGGKLQQITDYGTPSGTTIIVKDLFLNIPARRKFLKSVSTEINHIADIVASTALARPDIRFKLTHNNKIIKDWVNSSNQIDRISDVIGYNISKQLLPFKTEKDNIKINGWIAIPEIHRTTTRSIYIFVNGRYIKDKIMHHSLISAYSRRLMKGKYPVAIVFINLPHSQVDVNVHPSKYAVRFANQDQIHDMLKTAIRRVLQTLDQLKWNFPIDSTASSPSTRHSFSKSKCKNSSAYQNMISERKSASYDQTSEQKTYTQSNLWPKNFFSDLTIIGQHNNTYIICESRKNLIIIDQHAAHERIIFEQLQLSVGKGKSICQNLLMPELIEVNFTEAKILKRLIPYLNSYGLEIESFGGNTFIVKTVPTLIKSNKILTIIMELIEKTANIGIKANIQTIMNECLSLIACHNAIRAKQKLSNLEIKTILHQLDACVNPSHCPHGRPTWIKLDLFNLEKEFRRK